MQFIYVMDPMCSWCWAFAPVMQQLRRRYPQIPVTTLMGGLAPDSEQPMPMAMQTMLQQIWHHIEATTGTGFNHQFWQQCQPRRSTWPACRAVIAAEQCEAGAGERMIAAIQHAYYQQARNPSEPTTLTELAEEIGLDKEAFRHRLNSAAVEQQFQAEMALKDRWMVSGFPALLLEKDDELYILSSGYSSWEKLEKRLKQKGLGL